MKLFWAVPLCTTGVTTYLAMQKYINQWLSEAGNIRIKTLEGYGKLKGALNKGGKAKSSGKFDFSSYPVAGGR